MEAGNRCKDEKLPEETNRRIVDIISDVNLAYSEHARRYLHECGLPKERTYVTGSPMAEVLDNNFEEIISSDILNRLSLEPKNIYCYLLIEKKTSMMKKPLSLYLQPSIRWRKNMICPYCIHVTQEAGTGLKKRF